MPTSHIEKVIYNEDEGQQSMIRISFKIAIPTLKFTELMLSESNLITWNNEEELYEYNS